MKKRLSKNLPNNGSISSKQILSFKEACLYLDVSSSTLYKLNSRKELTYHKPRNGKVYYEKSVLEKFLLKNKQPSVEERQMEILNNLKKNKQWEIN